MEHSFSSCGKVSIRHSKDASFPEEPNFPIHHFSLSILTPLDASLWRLHDPVPRNLWYLCENINCTVHHSTWHKLKYENHQYVSPYLQYSFIV